MSIPFRLILRKILIKYGLKPIDNGILRMVLCLIMNEIQKIIATLEEKGWTLAALADELEVAHNTVEKWKAGDRQPANSKAIFAMMDKIASRKRIPKKKRYIRDTGKTR
jgi:ribosome-binding protein aMBF1 (putative translation factor)